MMSRGCTAALGAAMLYLSACSGQRGAGGVFQVVMPDVQEGGELDLRFVGGEYGGEDNSPAFEFKSWPRGTQAWAFLVEVKRDEGPWRSFFMTTNHSPETEAGKIPEGYFNEALTDRMNPTTGADGWTVFEHQGERIYHGPLADMRYLGSRYEVRFSFYALSAKLALKDGFRRQDFDRAARGKVLGHQVVTAYFTVK